MRAIPEALAGHIAGGVTTLCRCWRLTRRDGVVFGFTDHDRDLTFDGVTYQADSGLAPSEAESQLGLAVSTGEVSGALTGACLTETDIASGLYDDADIACHLVNWADTSQRLLLETASIGEIRRSDNSFVAELRGPLHRYDQEQGRSYTDACTADLGDACCKVDLASRTVEAPVSSTDGRLALTIDHPALDTAGAFTAGRVHILSGANAGVTRMIQQQVGNDLLLWEPLLRPLMTGDVVRVIPGCDKSFETCQARFANTVNFRGFPHIPTPDFILTYARPGEGGYDGGALDP